MIGIFDPSILIEQPVPTPTLDPLALPELSEHPSQVEVGSSVYYYHCMPCHGDQGQGLTDEWRSVWEEDHQNCWAKGCHSVRDQDEVFTIPTVVPPVIGSINHQSRLSEPEVLFEYLKTTHPPQNPGVLKDDDYWALTAFLLAKNGFLAAKGEVVPLGKSHQQSQILGIAAWFSAISLVVFSFLVIRKRKRSQPVKKE
jgi:cytochrome c